MPADGLHDGHAGIDQLLAQVKHLAHAGADVVLVQRLLDARGQGFHVASGHAAVGVQPFVDHRQVGRVFIDRMIVDGQKAADVDQRVLLGAHGAAVGVRAHLLDDGGNGAILAARFPLLDEEGVFHHARGIQNHADAVRCANSLTALALASEMGCPPARFTVAAMLMYGMRSAP